MRHIIDKNFRHIGPCGWDPDPDYWMPGKELPFHESDRGSTDKAADSRKNPDDGHQGSSGDPVDPAGCGPIKLADSPVMLMTCSVYDKIMDYLTSRKPEAGGMLVGPKDHDMVTHFVADPTAHVTGVSYTPNAEALNKVLKLFLACEMDAKGMVHSHPAGVTRPSYGDIEHVRSSFGRKKNVTAQQYLLPIVCDKRLYPYLMTRDMPDRVQFAQLKLV